MNVMSKHSRVLKPTRLVVIPSAHAKCYAACRERLHAVSGINKCHDLDLNFIPGCADYEG